MRKVLYAFIIPILVINLHSQKTQLTAVVTKIVGNVQIKQFQTGKIVTATNGMFVYEGDTLITKKNSKAAITFTNSVEIKIDENTEFEIKVEQAKVAEGNTLYLKKGSIFTSAFRKVSKFEIHSPIAIAAIRGTKFNTSVKESLMEVTCEEGEVKVSNDKGEQIVKGGESTTVTVGEAPKPPQKTSDEKKKEVEETYKEVKIEYRLKISIDKTILQEGEIGEIKIEVIDSKDKVVKDYDKILKIITDSSTMKFSTDEGKTWAANNLKPTDGKAKILFKDEKAGLVGISFSSEDLQSSIIQVEIKQPKAKTLKIKLRSEDGTEHQLKLKFER